MLVFVIPFGVCMDVRCVYSNACRVLAPDVCVWCGGLWCLSMLVKFNVHTCPWLFVFGPCVACVLGLCVWLMGV